MYCPPTSKSNRLKTCEFLDQWPEFLDKYVAEQNDLLLLGDVSFHLDNVKDYNTKKFLTHF